MTGEGEAEGAEKLIIIIIGSTALGGPWPS